MTIRSVKAWALAMLLMLLCGLSAQAEEAVDYEISNYAMYVDVRADGSARIREEIIYTCPHSYEGYAFFIDDSGEPEDIEAWADGELLDEGARTLTADEKGWLITLSAPGDNDWRTFACAYTLKDYAVRHDDAGMIDRALISAKHAVLYQNATLIVTLPEENGEILVYPRDYAGDVRTQYNVISFGPTDLAAGAGVSAQLLFPAQWLKEAAATGEAVRESIVSEKTRIQEEKTRSANTIALIKRVLGAAYLLIFALLLAWEIKKYGVSAKKLPAPDWTLLDRYPAAMAGFVVGEAADSDVLVGSLADLAVRGNVRIDEDESGALTLTRTGKNVLSASDKAALAYVFDGQETVNPASIAQKSYDKARRKEDQLRAYGDALAREVEKAHLKRRNESELIGISTASLFCGLTLTIVLLMWGGMMIFEGAIVSVGMFVMMKQYNRVRHLTDAGEALKAAAIGLCGKTDEARAERDAHRAAAASLGALASDAAPDARLLDKLAQILRGAHVGNASMRKKRAKK